MCPTSSTESEQITVNCFEEHLLSGVKRYESTDIRLNTSKMIQRDTFDAFIVQTVHYRANITEEQQPSIAISCAGPIEKAIGFTFDGLVAPFYRILMLLVRFTLPTTYAKSA